MKGSGGFTQSGANMTATRTASVAELRSSVRELTTQWAADGAYTPRSDSWVRSYDVAFSKALAEQGLIGMTWPRRVGGGEYSNCDRLAVTEELLRAGAPVAAHWIADRQIGPAILRHGSAELQEEILPAIVSADALFCLGMSEHEAGSDLAAVRTVAKPVQGGWILRGRKIWTTGAHFASHVYVLARTWRAQRKHDGLSEFVVDMDAAGVTVSPITDMAGQHHFNEVLLDDVFVPRGRLLGVEGNGWRQVIEQLSFERGGPERVLSTYPLLIEVLKQSDQIADRRDEARLGILVARLATLRCMAWEVAAELDRGGAPVQQAATLKYLGNTFERDVIEFGREYLPTNGSDSPFGQALLASPGFSIRGGAADVLLSIISRQEVYG
jgi:acyl-CoA dehydrogenase